MGSVSEFQEKCQASLVTVDRGNLYFNPSVDAEYESKPDRPTILITTQIGLSESLDDAIMLEHPKLGLGIKPTWGGRCIYSELLGWREVYKEETSHQLMIETYGLQGWTEITKEKEWKKLVIDANVFFSPVDALAACFNDFELCRHIQRNLLQDTRMRIDSGTVSEKTGKKSYSDVLNIPLWLDSGSGIYQIAIKYTDLSRLIGGVGLGKMVGAFGGKMEYKGVMDAYKTNMLTPYTNPELIDEFERYALGDVIALPYLRRKNKERMKKLFEVHNLTVPEREILTPGALVSELFITYTESFVGKYNAWTLFTKGKPNSDKRYPWTLKDVLEKASVGYYATKKESNKASLALVQGGRAKNENPTETKVTGVIADADIVSAYASIMCRLIYPIGIPKDYGQHITSDKKITLGWVLKKESKELIDGLWSFIVRGKVSPQTLVPSKIVDAFEISEVYDEADPKIPGDFRLLTHEVINGTITSDVLEALKNSCTNTEWRQWMDLEVVGGVLYERSKKCETPQEWYEKTEAHIKEHGNGIEEYYDKEGKKRIVDNRSRFWLAVSLKDFLEPYINLRKAKKKEMWGHEKGSDTFNRLYAEQESLKLVPNTGYGAFASPLLPVGNVVVAMNITAGARVYCWCMAVALRANLSITDGCPFDLNRVVVRGESKPSMETLANIRRLESLSKLVRRNIKVQPLGGKEWTVSPGKVQGGDRYTILSNGEVTIEAKEEQWKEIDKLVMEHVRGFFNTGKNDITIIEQLDIGLKDVYVELIPHSQTNYQLTHATGSKVTKARGHKLTGAPYEGDLPSNVHKMFEDIRTNPSAVPGYEPQRISQILKCNQANKMLNSKTPNVLQKNGLLAGDSIWKQSWLRVLSIAPFHWQTYDQYESWSKGNEKLKEISGWGVEQYFLNPDDTVDYQRALIEIQQKIDEGEMWIVPTERTKGKSKYEAIKNHPHYEGDKTVNEGLQGELEFD